MTRADRDVGLGVLGLGRWVTRRLVAAAEGLARARPRRQYRNIIRAKESLCSVT